MSEAVGAVLSSRPNESAPEPLADAQRAAERVATGGSATLAVAELAARLRRRGIRVERATLANWLLDWQRRGIAEQVEPGRWRLTPEGARRFAGFSIIGRG
ncbi:MAG TPA: hypothetical protein VIJ84_06495 [Gaiellaceae bacterium]